MSSRTRLIASFGASAWSALMGFAFVPAYIRYLGVEAYGLVGFFAGLQAWLVLLDLGLSPALGREVVRARAGHYTPQQFANLLRTSEGVAAAFAAGVAALVVVAAPLIARRWLNLQALSSETAVDAIRVMAGIVFFRWMSTLYQSIVLGQQDQVWLGAATASVATIRGGVVVLLLAYVDASPETYFSFQLAVTACEAGLLRWRAFREVRAEPRFAWATIFALRGYASGVFGITLISTVLLQSDKLILSAVLALPDYAVFMLSTTVAGVLYMGVRPIWSVCSPRLNELVALGDERLLRGMYHAYAQLAAVTVIPLAAVLVAFGPRLLLWWTRNPELAASTARVLVVWIPGTALHALMHIPYAAQLAHGETRLGVYSNLIGALLVVPGYTLLAPIYGAVAAGWVWCGINCAHALVTLPIMHRTILRGELRRWYVRGVGVPLATATLCVVAGFWGMEALSTFTGVPLSRASEMWAMVAIGLVTLLSTAAVAGEARSLLSPGR